MEMKLPDEVAWRCGQVGRGGAKKRRDEAAPTERERGRPPDDRRARSDPIRSDLIKDALSGGGGGGDSIGAI